MPGSVAEIHAWLAAFARCVREQDFAGARALFAPEVRAFGTVAHAVSGIDELLERQWRPVWTATHAFDFDPDAAARVVSLSPDGELAWVASRWSSMGGSPSGDGARHGRATLVLCAHASGWLAVHTHFSLDPEPPA
jgi:ketosteroid isomerase-like protein